MAKSEREAFRESAIIEKRAYIICPVRGITEEENQLLRRYVQGLEERGFAVHFPPRDTEQEDPEGGFNICIQNYQAMVEADEIHYYFNPKSQGSLFDFGIAFALHMAEGKPVRLINREAVLEMAETAPAKKGFEFVVLKVAEE